MSSKLVIELNDAKFKEEIESSKVPVMIDFWANWCAPCRMMASTVDEIANDYKDRLKVAKINVDENQSVAAELGIMNIPSFVFFKNGKEVLRLTGALPKRDLVRHIEKII